MGFAVSQVFGRVFGALFWRRVARGVVGVFQDFWKDGKPLSEAEKRLRAAAKEKVKKASVVAKAAGKVAQKTVPEAEKVWAADRPQILQKMWGAGYILPGGDAFTDILMNPVGLTRQMSVVDMAAGLGGLARKLATDFGTYVTGYEVDPDFARIGMVMSLAAGKAKQAVVTHYDPLTYEHDRTYDALVARELFYKIQKKGHFFKVLSQSVKPHGHMAFTDFIVPPLLKNDPEIKDWISFEGDVAPLSLPEMIGVWKMNGFDVRINEDQTDFYKHQVVEGLSRFADFLREHKPDPSTVHLIEAEVELWQRRAKALDHGLKFYRFYAIKN